MVDPTQIFEIRPLIVNEQQCMSVAWNVVTFDQNPKKCCSSHFRIHLRNDIDCVNCHVVFLTFGAGLKLNAFDSPSKVDVRIAKLSRLFKLGPGISFLCWKFVRLVNRNLTSKYCLIISELSDLGKALWPLMYNRCESLCKICLFFGGKELMLLSL